MNEPATPTTSLGINDSHYYPYHELGNIFSYPPILEQTEGYEGRQSLTQNTYSGPIRWNGANFNQEIKLSSTKTNQEGTKKINKKGAITRFLSAVDNIFGSKMAQFPENSDSSFTRTVTDGESISINIPEAYSGARFTALFETYLDVAGTMTSAFAVESFNRDDALWGSESLYTLKPDSSFLLPEKFDYTPMKDGEWDRAVFAVNNNDPTALKMRGVRFNASDYDLETDNLLMKGLKYTITVPVYNASFKNAENFKVRLSYAKTNKYNAEKTTIGEYTFANLPGWGSGVHRQTAVFTWTPPVEMEEGIYCYKLKPEAKGKYVPDMDDDDIDFFFIRENLDIFPSSDHKVNVRSNPAYLEDGVGFALQIHGEKIEPTNIVLTNIIYGKAGDGTGVSSSSSGGCETFAGSMAGVLALILIMKNRRS